MQASVDRLADAFERMATRLDAVQAPGAYGGTGGDKVTSHIRRYMPFYALATVWALMLLILPTQQDDGSRTTNEASALTPGGSQTYDDGGAAPIAGLEGDTAGGGGRGVGGSRARVAGQAAAGGSTPVAAAPSFTGTVDTLAWNQTGKTIGGFDCNNGVRQIPWSKYAVPCYPAWTKGNGGATSSGVTAKEITIVIRRFPESANSRAVEAARTAAGFASTDVARAVTETWMKYFNKVYELWGRKVKWIIYESQYGNSTDEAQSKGKEGACADADHIKQTFKAFGIIGGGSNVFAECAAERGMVTFQGGAYFPERWYDKLHPYAWHTVTDCERISNQVAEYIGKRLAGRPAKWAKQTEKGRTRKFAIYVPDNDEYQYCVNITEKRLKEDYNVSPGSRYNYVLDVSRFPDEAARAAIQFKADMTTTLVMACDPVSMVFLTQAAKGQQWWPEWFNIGVAANDTDNYPRLWDADEIRGSLFGMSQLGATKKLLGPKAEPAVTYRRATGTEIPEGTTGNPTYYGMMHLMNALQAAGPNLTPRTMADAIQQQPPGGAPDYPIGLVSFRDGPDGTRGATDHTAIEDSREIWWDHEGTGYDGEQGTYVETHGGKRFNNGQWPREEPPVFRK